MRGGSTIVFGWSEIGRTLEPIRARRACENAGLLARRFDGFASGLAAFIAAFVVYARLVLAVAPRPAPASTILLRRWRRESFSSTSALLMLKATGAAGENHDAAKTFASHV